MNIFDELRSDHDRQRELLSRVLSTSGASPARDAAWADLKDALEAHAAAEERHFYAPLFQADMTVEHARHGVAEHKDLDDLVERIDATETASPGWIQIAKQLAERLEHHLEEEEREFFPLAGRALSSEQKTALAGAYRADMRARDAA